MRQLKRPLGSAQSIRERTGHAIRAITAISDQTMQQKRGAAGAARLASPVLQGPASILVPSPA